MITVRDIEKDWTRPFKKDEFKYLVKDVITNTFEYWHDGAFEIVRFSLNKLKENYDKILYFDESVELKISYADIITKERWIARMPKRYRDKLDALVYELYCFCVCGAYNNISHIIFALDKLEEVIKEDDRQESVDG